MKPEERALDAIGWFISHVPDSEERQILDDVITAIKDAVAAENKMCVEILIKRAKNASGEIRDFAEEVAQAIEARETGG